jgi:hypothetical protein
MDEIGVPSGQEIAEKIKELFSVATTDDSHAHVPAKKKRKAGEMEGSSAKKERQPRSDEGEQRMTQKIKGIAKSATKRARAAQSKANGQGKKKAV